MPRTLTFLILWLALSACSGSGVGEQTDLLVAAEVEQADVAEAGDDAGPPPPACADEPGAFSDGAVAGALEALGAREIRALRVAGDRLYTGTPEGMEIYDVSDEQGTWPLGWLATSAAVRDLDVVGTTVFLALGLDGLAVVDASVPARPEVVATLVLEGPVPDQPSSVTALFVDGSRAYVLDSETGLAILDVSKPASPRVMGDYPAYDWSAPKPGLITTFDDVSVVSGLAYTVGSFAGLTALRVDNASAPTVIDALDLPGVTSVEARTGFVYVAGGADGLRIVEAPNLSLRGQLAMSIDGLHLEGDTLYAVDRINGQLLVIDVSDPDAPTSVSGRQGLYRPSSVEVYDDRAYVGTGNGLMVMSLRSRPFADAAPIPRAGLGLDAKLVGDYAYVAEHTSGLQILDVSDPRGPVLVGGYLAPYAVRRVELDGDRAWVLGSQPALTLLDVRDPAAPTVVATFEGDDVPGGAWAVATALVLDGDRAFVGETARGLRIVDISNVQDIREIGAFTVPSTYVADVALVGDTALVATGDSGLRLLDISDPAQPVYLGAFDPPGGYITRVQVDGTRAWVVDRDAGLHVIDVSALPDTPLIGFEALPGRPDTLRMVGDGLAFVSVGTSGLAAVDVANPENPTLLATIDTPGEATGFDLAGRYAFMADGNATFTVLDLGCTLDPVPVPLR